MTLYLSPTDMKTISHVLPLPLSYTHIHIIYYISLAFYISVYDVAVHWTRAWNIVQGGSHTLKNLAPVVIVGVKFSEHFFYQSVFLSGATLILFSFTWYLSQIPKLADSLFSIRWYLNQKPKLVDMNWFSLNQRPDPPDRFFSFPGYLNQKPKPAQPTSKLPRRVSMDSF